MNEYENNYETENETFEETTAVESYGSEEETGLDPKKVLMTVGGIAAGIGGVCFLFRKKIKKAVIKLGKKWADDEAVKEAKKVTKETVIEAEAEEVTEE